jgi:hypothetical protein
MVIEQFLLIGTRPDRSDRTLGHQFAERVERAAHLPAGRAESPGRGEQYTRESMSKMSDNFGAIRHFRAKIVTDHA